VTSINITGTSGHSVSIEAEGSDLQTVTRVIKALWTATKEPTESAGGGLGFSNERRPSLTHEHQIISRKDGR
jgi:hypothetical protein